MANKQPQIEPKYLRLYFRVLIVALAWVVASLLPDSPQGFFQSLFLASVTSWFEYAIIFLDSSGKIRKTLSFLGILGSSLFCFFSLFGLNGWVTLDVATDYISLGPKIPLRNADHMHLSYFTIVYFMWAIPFFTFAELPLRKTNQTPAKPSSRKAS